MSNPWYGFASFWPKAFLPSLWIAAGVEDSMDGYEISMLDEENQIWESMNQSAAGISSDPGK